MPSLEIVPVSHPLSASVRVPGSKSLTNRALLIASLADMVSHVRYQAAIALGELGGPAAEEALASTVQLDSDPTVRSVARESLRRVRRGEAQPEQVMDEEQVKDKET